MRALGLMVNKVKSAYHLSDLSPRHPDNPKTGKPNLLPTRSVMAKKRKAASPHKAHSSPPHTDSSDLTGAQEENPGGYLIFFVSWVFRRGTVSSTGHRNLECLQREGSQDPPWATLPGLWQPKREARPCCLSRPDLWGHWGQAAHQHCRKPSLVLCIFNSQCHT